MRLVVDMISNFTTYIIICKCSILPTLQREYKSTWRETDTSDDEPKQSKCFEILGIDIMIDSTLRPYLIEVNHLPSWGTDSPLDDAIKSQVVTQALQALNVKASDRQKFTSTAKRQSLLRLSKYQPSSSVDQIGDNTNGLRLSDVIESASDAKRREPKFFESNSAERRIQSIYAKHAPEKLDKIPVLLERFRGYEEWLVMKVQNKYDKNYSSSDDDNSSDSDSTHTQELLHAQHLQYQEEESKLPGYDRLYPPKGHGRIKPSVFQEMSEWIFEVDDKQQKRLLLPLQQIRSNGDSDGDKNVETQQQWSRADGWIVGNIHVKKISQRPKVIAPPTAKQIEFADRLSQGFSTGNITISRTDLQQRKSRILHNDLFIEEVNPFWHLTDRLDKARELSKEARQRAEMKLSRRTNTGVALRQQVVELGLSTDMLRISEDKFYNKKNYPTR